MSRTCFDLLGELFARDVDRDLLRRARERTPTERIIWLEEMQAFAAAVRDPDDDNEAATASRAAR